jgi:putative Holliday junction resolvase
MPVILGLDVGDARIGVAVSDELCIAAHRLCTIERKSLEYDIREIQKIIREKEVNKIVVGIPRRLSGEVGIQAQKVQKFVKHLKDNIEVPVDTWDERLTTVEAENILLSMDVSRRKRKKVIDQVAAALILESYLECVRGIN